MTGWPEVVTTALLGTGRRPLPSSLPASWATPSGLADRDPAVRLLELAARHRTVSRLCIPLAEPRSVTQPEPAPPVDRSAPPEASVAVLAVLLIRPTPALINFWLACADAAGCGVPASYWTRLARLAAHSTAYDRAQLGRVLGGRGRWFLRQNPDWRRLAADAGKNGRPRPKPNAGRTPSAETIGAETVRARPLSIFDHPDPWPPELVAAAYAVLGTGVLGRSARQYAAGVGARLPVVLYGGLGRAAEYYLQDPDASPARRRQLRECFVALEESAYARARIEHTFSGSDQQAGPLPRVDIPGV